MSSALSLGRAVAAATAASAASSTAPATAMSTSSACFGCLRRISIAPPAFSPRPFSFTQTRGAKGMSKAELEDLQGIPVRLLQDLRGFGRKHAIIRVKRGRMRNIWFPYGKAEYMTKKRFQEMGLTEASIGARDRSFGFKSIYEVEKDAPVAAVAAAAKKETLTLSPAETQNLLNTLLEPTLTFFRKPIASPPTPAAIAAAARARPEPAAAAPRSPSIAANAGTSQSRAEEIAQAEAEAVAEAQAAAAAANAAIFGSVSTADILASVKEALFAASPDNRTALEAASIKILDLAEGEDRVKKLGRFQIEIEAGKGLEPIRRSVEVVSEQQ